MTAAVSLRFLTGAEPLARRQTSSDVIALGMPQLSLGGVGETWLLKECGDRHWRLLGEIGERAASAFRDPGGAPVYAAFCAVSARDLRLDAFGEGDELAIASRIVRVSRTRFVSRHTLSLRGEPAGDIEMLSAFVRRTEPGRNRSIARVALDGFPETEASESRAAALAARFRGALFDAHLGFDREGAAPIAETALRPCPSQDFNGAGLLYFASFQAMADRAEWDLLDVPAVGVTTRLRDVIYYGNAEPGERLSLAVLGLRRSADALTHWMRVTREGAPLADIFTVRALQPER